MVLAIILIFILSSLSLYSLSPVVLPGQLTAWLIAWGLFWLFFRLGSAFHQHLAWYYYGFSLALLVINFIFSQRIHGSARWLRLAGLSFQASELVKPFLIVFFSYLAERFRPVKFKNILILLLVLVPPWLLIFRQPDLGSSLILLIIWLGIVFVSGLSFKYLAGLVILSLTSLPILNKILKPYQLERIKTFLNPLADPLGSGYHTLQALISVGSGRLLGKGLGRGSQVQLEFLPERQTDFIFASFSEETGFLGDLILLGLYSFLLIKILHILSQQKLGFKYNLLAGCFTAIFFQTLANLAINLGLLPVTGITLPLFSAGGSSLVATMMILGLVWAVKLETNSSSSLEIH